MLHSGQLYMYIYIYPTKVTKHTYSVEWKRRDGASTVFCTTAGWFFVEGQMPGKVGMVCVKFLPCRYKMQTGKYRLKKMIDKIKKKVTLLRTKQHLNMWDLTSKCGNSIPSYYYVKLHFYFKVVMLHYNFFS